MRSPIKYYGGKSYMTKDLIDRFPADYKVYVEGFGGGASVLFSKPQDGIEVYNDLYQGVYSLFKVMQDDEKFDKLKKRMDLSLYSRQLHDEYAAQLQKGDMDLEETAYRYLYVNRSSFNGVGGFSVSKYVRRGMCKSASDWLSMIDGLRAVHERLSSVVVECMDIFDLIDKYDAPDTLFYLDPPYPHSTRKSSQRYCVEMSDEDHQKLVDRISNITGHVILTVYDHPIYDMLESTGYIKESIIRPNSKDVETIYRNYRWGD